MHSLAKAHVIRNHHPALPGDVVLDSLLLERHQLVPKVGLHPAQVNADVCGWFALSSECVADPSWPWGHNESWSKTSGLAEQHVVVVEGKKPHLGLRVVLARGKTPEDLNERGATTSNLSLEETEHFAVAT